MMNSEQNKKVGMSLSSKVLLGIIGCIILIIILIIMLLANMKQNASIVYTIELNGEVAKDVSFKDLLTSVEDKTYINIQEFAKFVGYDYHEGEYKAYVTDKNKCYVQGKDETASFYLDDNKVYKLPVNKLTEEYNEYVFEDKIISIEGKMYAPVDAITTAFNVIVELDETYFQAYTLDYMISFYDKKVKEWGYTGIEDQSFENDKALLYGYLIVKKEGGEYKVIDLEQKEITLDRYSNIQFSEYLQEFYVTDNTTKKAGVINLDGTIKINSDYESVVLLDKEKDLYLVRQNQKYGVVKGGNILVIFPEFDIIGLNNTNILSNKYILLDTLIPVCKGQKWGAYDKQGRKVIDIIYDGFGYDLNTIDINGTKEIVEPIVEIKRANGIVVKKDGKYGLLDVTAKQLIKPLADSIYGISNIVDEEEKYFMVYNGEKMNIVKELVNQGLIEKEQGEKEETSTNTILNTIITNVVQ